jgi:hypothetical protein
MEKLLSLKFLKGFKTCHIPLPSPLNSALLTFLSIIIYTTFSHAVQVTLEWKANTDPDLAGYIIYQGTSSRGYDTWMDVGNWTSATIADLEDSETHYFNVTAYDIHGNESGYTDEVCINCNYPVQGTIGTELTISRWNF